MSERPMREGWEAIQGNGPASGHGASERRCRDSTLVVYQAYDRWWTQLPRHGYDEECGSEADAQARCEEIHAARHADALRELAPHLLAPQWIPVGERLPEARHPCLVVDRGGAMHVADIADGADGEWWMSSVDKPVPGVVMWSSLPAPPEVSDAG
jgi:hypothetical protein